MPIWRVVWVCTAAPWCGGKRGEAPAPQNYEQLVGLDAVVSLLEGFSGGGLDRQVAARSQRAPGERRPIDVIGRGGSPKSSPRSRLKRPAPFP